jgi:hypothetical protein
MMLSTLQRLAVVFWAFGQVSCAFAQPLPEEAVLKFKDTPGDVAALQFLRSSGRDWSVSEDLLAQAHRVRVTTDRLGLDFHTSLESLLRLLSVPGGVRSTYRTEGGIYFIRTVEQTPGRKDQSPIPLPKVIPDPRVSLHFDRVPLDRAVSQLFEATNTSYVLVHPPDPSPVSITLSGQSVKGALSQICPTTDVYWLENRPERWVVQSLHDEHHTPLSTSARLSVEMRDADVRYALRTLFMALGVNFTLDVGVQGNVTFGIHDVLPKTALETILRSASLRLTYRIEDNVYFIVPAMDFIQ